MTDQTTQTTDTTQNVGGQAAQQGGQPAQKVDATQQQAQTDGQQQGGQDAKAGTGTVLDKDVDGKQGPADWPDDWRQKMAGGDAKLLKQLETFTSPADVYKAHRALQQKLTSGEYKKATALPDNATEEQIAEWRKENGIPAKWEEYDTALPDGLVIGEDDKPIVDEVLKAMHATNAPPAVVQAALGTYFKLQENHRAAMAEADSNTLSATVEELRGEWGPEYKRNQNAIAAYLDTLPEEFRDNLIGARLADGTKLLGNAAGVRFLAQLAREANPAITAFPGSSNPAKSIEDELKSLNVGSEEYWKSPEKQKRARELYALQDKLKQKSA